jgi:lactate dehydrogenase-like 2-hydroxyacid dehydrogenase
MNIYEYFPNSILIYFILFYFILFYFILFYFILGKKTVQKIAGLVSKVICYDAYPANDWIKTIPNAEYVTMDQLLSQANIISIHVPLLPETHHMVNTESIAKMKKNVIIVSVFY